MISNNFRLAEAFMKRASFLSIREAVKKQIEYYEIPKRDLTPIEIEKLWQLRDFIEIFDIMVKPL